MKKISYNIDELFPWVSFNEEGDVSDEYYIEVDEEMWLEFLKVEKLYWEIKNKLAEEIKKKHPNEAL